VVPVLQQDVGGVAEVHNEPFEVYPEMVVDAMIAADAFGRQRRAVLGGEARLPAAAQ
jgi:glycerol dehydrogenase